jgi:two-component system, OmpR family, response regulator
VPQTLLLVDDDPPILDTLSLFLEKQGFTIYTADGGEKCISLLGTVKPDLILLDIMMEPMDGWETLDRIKANPATSDVPVLMFSAKKITPEEAHDHSLNIEDFVSKPVNPAHLMESIKRIFQRRCDVKQEAMVAKDAGLDSGLIEEYSALRKSIEVDRNLLAVLKNASAHQNSGREVSSEDADAVKHLEEKIECDEKRLKEINEKFPKAPDPLG